MKANVGIVWKQCADLPITTNIGKPILVNGKVYCEGRFTLYENVDGESQALKMTYYNMCCYDPTEDNWTTLPQHPGVNYVGLGEVDGQLVAVGGESTTDGCASNNVYTYNEQSNEWNETIPPMPTGRIFPGCLSLPSVLIVAGGCCDLPLMHTTNVVEIFKPDTSQWYTADPLPTPCIGVSLVAIGDTCYALGGLNLEPRVYISQSNSTSVDNLVGTATPSIQSSPIYESDLDDENIVSSWKEHPDTPTYRPTGAVLAGNLIAVGGTETDEGGATKKDVYMYSPSANSWVYISDLPAPRYAAGVASLSPSEILVIGGRCNEDETNSVYKGTLNLKM